MLKHTLKYKDFNGKEEVGDFYFNLSKSELVEHTGGEEGGEDLETIIRRITKTSNMGALLREFRKIVLKSIGKRSADGSRFVKSQEIASDFVDSNAYEALFEELVLDDPTGGKLADFIIGILPSEMRPMIQESFQQTGTPAPAQAPPPPIMTVAPIQSGHEHPAPPSSGPAPQFQAPAVPTTPPQES